MEKIVLLAIFLLYSSFLALYIYSPSNLFMGRPIWFNPPRIMNLELDSQETSQQIADIYSLSHITHGILFYNLFKYLNIDTITGLFLTIIIEITWETFENTPYIIRKYRKKKEFENYMGDSIANVTGDIIFTIIGYYLGNKAPEVSIIYVILSEILLIPFNANFLHLSLGSLY